MALEGGEAVGKTTQAAILAARLGALLTREPGGTALGERLRALLLERGQAQMEPRAEALVTLADRAQHVQEVLMPALESGRWVVTDRYSGSTLAYQGWGRGLDRSMLETLCDWASVGLWPDLSVLLVTPSATGRRVGPPDRIEAAGATFHDRVARGFLEMAARDPSCWAVVDGEGPPERVAERVAAAVHERLGWPAGAGRRATSS